MSLLPNYSNATVDISKARVFLSALSIASKNADFLKFEILNGLHSAESIEVSSTRYGKKYLVDMIIINFDKKSKCQNRLDYSI